MFEFWKPNEAVRLVVRRLLRSYCCLIRRVTELRKKDKGDEETPMEELMEAPKKKQRGSRLTPTKWAELAEQVTVKTKVKAADVHTKPLIIAQILRRDQTVDPADLMNWSRDDLNELLGELTISEQDFAEPNSTEQAGGTICIGKQTDVMHATYTPSALRNLPSQAFDQAVIQPGLPMTREDLLEVGRTLKPGSRVMIRPFCPWTPERRRRQSEKMRALKKKQFSDPQQLAALKQQLKDGKTKKARQKAAQQGER